MPDETSASSEQLGVHGLHGLLEDMQAAALAPLTTIPEIAESETLRKAAERLQQSQNDLYQSLKDVYPSAVLNPAERERFSTAIVAAREESDSAAETSRVAQAELRQTAVSAASFGMSELYIGRLAGVSRSTIRQWRLESTSEPGS